jgi:hypothetical protein
MSASRATSDSPVFVYGVLDPLVPTAIGLDAIYPPATGALAPAAPTPVARGLATRPVKSPDGSFIAAIKVAKTKARITVEVVDAVSAIKISSGSAPLSGLPTDASLLITPVFTSDASTLALVLSVSVPSGQQTIEKVDPRTGGHFTVSAATWRSHHEVLYFDSRSGTGSGPFNLGDAPSLALVDAVASRDSLFLWTLGDAQKIPKTKGDSAAPPVPQLAAYPVGRDTPRFSISAPGYMPTSNRNTIVLPSGAIVRLVAGRGAEIYSSDTGVCKEATVPFLGLPSGKPGVVTLKPLHDSHLLIANSVLGRAVTVDASGSFRELSTLEFPRPKFACGTPLCKAALSPDADQLYVLGSREDGGLTAYELAAGTVADSGSAGTHYTGVEVLPGGAVAALRAGGRKLDFFDRSLRQIGGSTTPFTVTGML